MILKTRLMTDQLVFFNIIVIMLCGTLQESTLCLMTVLFLNGELFMRKFFCPITLNIVCIIGLLNSIYNEYLLNFCYVTKYARR